MKLGRVAVQAGGQTPADQSKLASINQSLVAENSALKKQVNQLLKEVIYYQRMSSGLMEEKNREEIDASEIYLKIAG